METRRGGRTDANILEYPAVRGSIQDGDIVLFRGKTWISRLIRWFTRSEYSHAGIVAWWHGRLMVLEAVPAGVMASRLSIVVSKYSGKAELWTTDGQLIRDEVVMAAQLLLGKRYSKSKLLRNLRRLLLGPSREEPPDPEMPPDAFVCSEYVSRTWRAGGLDLKKDVPDRFTKPSDIAKSPLLRKVGDLYKSGKRPDDQTKGPHERDQRDRDDSPGDRPGGGQPGNGHDRDHGGLEDSGVFLG